MVRGHAEALMPLIARVMDQAGIEFAELDRIAVTTGPAASPACGSASRPRAASRSPPASRRSGCRRWPPSPRRISPRTTTSAVVVGDRCAARARLPAGVRPRRPHRWCRRASRRSREAVRAATASAGAHRRLRRRAARRALAGERAAAGAGRAARRARHRLGRAARRRRRRRPRRRRSRSICARPTRSRRTPRACRADDRTSHAPVRAQRAGAVGSDAARRRRDRDAARRVVPPRLERGRVRAAADRAQRAHASRHA